MRRFLYASLVFLLLLSLDLAWIIFGVKGSLHDLLPQVPTAMVANDCDGPIKALPASELRVLLPALSAAETRLDVQLAGGLTCDAGVRGNLPREFYELRAARRRGPARWPLLVSVSLVTPARSRKRFAS
jgi:hypothetical protein